MPHDTQRTAQIRTQRRCMLTRSKGEGERSRGCERATHPYVARVQIGSVLSGGLRCSPSFTHASHGKGHAMAHAAHVPKRDRPSTTRRPSGDQLLTICRYVVYKCLTCAGRVCDAQCVTGFRYFMAILPEGTECTTRFEAQHATTHCPITPF